MNEEITTTQEQSLTIQQAIDLAVQHHQAGNLPKAESIYQQILQAEPNQPIALNLLGVIKHQLGKYDIAVDLITKAVAIKPDYAEAHSHLGIALQELGKLDGAVASYNKAIAIKPDYAEAYSNLGLTLQDQGKIDEAVASYNKALSIKPDYAEAHYNLGIVLQEFGKLDAAVASYNKAIAVKPDYAEAYSNLGNILKELGQLGAAVASYNKALTIKTDYAEAHYNLGIVLQEFGKLDAAVASYNKAIAVKPDYAEAYSNLGNVLKELGQLDEAVASYNKALAIKPDYAKAHSNRLFAEQYRLRQNAKTLYMLHKDWDERHAQQWHKIWPAHLNTPDAGRVLRIGFVSPDLGRHPVGYFLIHLFENIIENEIKIIAYSDRVADDLTDRFKVASSLWRDVKGTSDNKLSKIILEDGIDILFDLSGHTANNRLLLFAKKPAPIQVSWAGYVGTTGMSSMDYLLSDVYSTPAGEEKYYSEKIIRMSNSWLCYDPPDYAPDVGPSPFKQNGGVTFCSFSSPAKINEEVIPVWAKIMSEVKNSHLLIKYKGIDTKTNIERLRAKFEAQGIHKSRLTLEGRSPHIELLARYNDVDIALDPFPYSGGLTTYEALWMGVPVITVPGQTFASRHSLSHLSTIGLPELVAKNKDDYVRLAIDLSGDPERISELRAGLRSKMVSSTICDGKKFTVNFTAIMQGIWREWCLAQDRD